MQQDETTTPLRYTYETAGFNGFLSRSIEEQSTTSRALAFDRFGTSGSLGDTIQVGNILIDGANKYILLSDGRTNRILLGQLPDGSQGFVIVKEGEDVLTAAA